jgi:hypothetical protein
MTDASHTLRPFRKLETALREAVTESKLAYDFGASTYTFSTLNACIAAERALDVLRDALADTTEADALGERSMKFNYK